MLNHVALESAKAELLHFQEMSKKLQSSVVTIQKELEMSYKDLEVERSTVTKLELSVKQMEGVKSQLESTSLKVTEIHQQLIDRDGVIDSLKEEMKCLQASKEQVHAHLQAVMAELETGKKNLNEVYSKLLLI